MIFSFLFAKTSLQILPVEACDVIDCNMLRAFHFTCTGVRAVTESKFVHLGNHSACAAGCLRFTLRKESQ